MNRNTAFEGNLQKNLEDLESQRARSIHSLREKKLNFLERKSTLPKLRISLPAQGVENTRRQSTKSPMVTKRLSLDNSTFEELCERKLATKERLSVPSLSICQTAQEMRPLTKPGGERNEKFQPVISDVHSNLSNSPGERRRQSENLPHGTRKALDRQLSLPVQKTSVALNGEQYGSDPDVSECSLRVPAPFASLGTQLPLSPLLQKRQRARSLCPVDLQQSVSLPSSPRFSRRRADTWSMEASQERKDVFADLSRPQQHSKETEVPECGR